MVLPCTLITLVVLFLAHTAIRRTNGFAIYRNPLQSIRSLSIPFPLRSSIADGSEYAADVEIEEAEDIPDWDVRKSFSEEDETPSVELQPVPLSKNAGNRFIALVWDRDYHETGKDPLEMHEERIELSEDHVMFCRKQNLYNETFNTESMVDVVWSLQILSSDLRRTIGHAMCLESTQLHHAQECLARDPIVQKLTNNGDISKVPLYRWRHLKDSTLRFDDGCEGFPCICVALDHASEDLPDATGIRESLRNETLEHMIRSERIIATGPMHVPTTYKNDPSSLPVGDWIMFNAKDREDAVQFAEQLPAAKAGLYRSMRVHFYNLLDTTGKFVSEDPLQEAPCADLKEAMEYWGYPVDDEQTPWLNW